ncbi:MAG: hypothetical protein GC182_08435 [Rhodopseudomonas sp.]|nr:hypothetical protein [Rhodopseudomonas sp.]
MLACALALAGTAANAHSKRAHAGAADLIYCAKDQSYRVACPGLSGAVEGHRASRRRDGAGNPIAAREAAVAVARGYCRTDTAAGPIVIACGLRRQMVGFIADVVARGFKGRVHCFALGGHVRYSLHYRAEACDFAQRGWGKTVRPMYRVADLARKWGLRDGCTFRDCGHIDSGRGIAKIPWPARLADLKAGHFQ